MMPPNSTGYTQNYEYLWCFHGSGRQGNIYGFYLIFYPYFLMHYFTCVVCVCVCVSISPLWMFKIMETCLLDYSNHVYLWQLSPQHSCGDICHKWTWYSKYNQYFYASEKRGKYSVILTTTGTGRDKSSKWHFHDFSVVVCAGNCQIYIFCSAEISYFSIYDGWYARINGFTSSWLSQMTWCQISTRPPATTILTYCDCHINHCCHHMHDDVIK